MKRRENGFTLLELSVVLALSATIALTTTIFSFHAFNTTARTASHLTAVANVDNAGYWVSRDGVMADDVITSNLTAPAILILKWTDWGYGTDNIYYSATYSIENLSGGIGQLKRELQSSNGIEQHLNLASNIYYDPADAANSTTVAHVGSVINLRVASRFGNASETRNYQIHPRPNF
ncbi:MAG: prepilin-type N-terminal cleavage/methylation domain-containing protein [Dehalococcoidales bacterium]|nr:prepilin-type N-terminal cleavage/methylation domain-containing protein [Dehalococcoidales bacterium]